MIRRASILNELRSALSRNRVVVLTGPRQCGKTTLARELLDSDSVNYFDLEDPSIRHALADLGLYRVAVIYPGSKRFPLGERVEAVPVHSLAGGESLFAEDEMKCEG